MEKQGNNIWDKFNLDVHTHTNTNIPQDTQPAAGGWLSSIFSDIKDNFLSFLHNPGNTAEYPQLMDEVVIAQKKKQTITLLAVIGIPVGLLLIYFATKMKK